MNTVSSKDLKKILIVTAIFLLLLLGIVYIRTKRRIYQNIPTPIQNKIQIQITQTQPADVSPVGQSGIMVLKLDKGQITAGDALKATVFIQAPGRTLVGADLVLLYDSHMLAVSSSDISEGRYFDSYPIKRVNESQGVIKVSGFGVLGNLPADNISFATIQFKSLKAGTASLTFDFTPGSTNKSTIVEKGTSKNILGRVENATVVIK